MRLTLPMPNANNVAAGQTATWDLPIGRRYHNLFLEYSGVTLPQMTEIRITANGSVIHRYSGAERDSMNQFDGRAAAAGVLVVPFDRYALYSQGGEERTAIQTNSADPKTGVKIVNFKVEIDIDAAAAAPVINITAEQSNNLTGALAGPGKILRILPFVRTFTASGEVELSDLPKATEGPAYQFINRVFFKSANMTKLEIVQDNVQLFKRTKALNERLQSDGVRVPQSGYFAFDPVEAGYDYELLPLVYPTGAPVQDFRYKPTLSAGETVKAIVEYLGSL
ncbi:MAG TPA: major capsid protein P2 [Solimonas sp.]|nr:major capsid protein P2 [Solimonas sp.]